MSLFCGLGLHRLGHGYILITLLPSSGSDTSPSADPSLAKGSTVVYRARFKVPIGRRLVVSSEDEAGGQGVVTLRTSSNDELEGLFVSKEDVLVAPSPEAGGLATQETSAIKVVYGKWAPSSLLGELIALALFAPSSGLKISTGFDFARSHGEIVELSGVDPRLKSRLSSPPQNIQPGRSPSEVVVGAAEVAVVMGASSAKDVPPLIITKDALGDAPSSTAPTSPTSRTSKAATGVCLAGRESVLTISDDAQGEGPAAKFELEALSLENLAVVQSFHSSHVGELTGQLNARAAMAEQSKVTLAALRVEFDLYQSLDEARAEGKVQFLEAEVSSLHSEAKATKLAQLSSRSKSAGAEMRLSFIARDRAINEAKEARKAKAKAKLEAHSL
ncbi:hypothetical protein PanWU01x14_318440 [Parasponia andersonii]|uniref:Uncharacterized protein n=1 Tax=Parasponia andersonii TaxID=3476 RepID=A0A2P5AM93_PARAD|nr:hypothetical protein PanWU01x14_318440 [Parasponia andersonii]